MRDSPSSSQWTRRSLAMAMPAAANSRAAMRVDSMNMQGGALLNAFLGKTKDKVWAPVYSGIKKSQQPATILDGRYSYGTVRIRQRGGGGQSETRCEVERSR